MKVACLVFVFEKKSLMNNRSSFSGIRLLCDLMKRDGDRKEPAATWAVVALLSCRDEDRYGIYNWLADHGISLDGTLVEDVLKKRRPKNSINCSGAH